MRYLLSFIILCFPLFFAGCDESGPESIRTGIRAFQGGSTVDLEANPPELITENSIVFEARSSEINTSSANTLCTWKLVCGYAGESFTNINGCKAYWIIPSIGTETCEVEVKMQYIDMGSVTKQGISTGRFRY